MNPTSPGSGSSTDISLIPPHVFSVTSGFGWVFAPSSSLILAKWWVGTYASYFNGCDGAGADCTNQNCNTAFHQPNDTGVQVACQIDNVSDWSCAEDVDICSLLSPPVGKPGHYLLPLESDVALSHVRWPYERHERKNADSEYT